MRHRGAARRALVWASGVVTAMVVTLVGATVAPSMSGAAAAEALTAARAPVQNPVLVENRRPGSTGWRIPWSGLQVANDGNMAIKGYASATSINIGEAVGIKVHSATPGPATYRVYRLGWYQGLGGRYVTGGSFTAVPQPACATDPSTGLIACPWSTTFTLQSTSDWTSGVYVVVLTRGTYQSYASFVVRDDARTAALVHMQPTLTYQAYNNFPNDGKTGKSLYAYNSFGPVTVGGSTAAVKVSFDRPYWNSGAAMIMSDEAPLIRYQESRGFDVTYATNVDLDSRPNLLDGQRALLSAGHDEYWTSTMFTQAEKARDAGVDVAFLGGNNIYWQVRLEPSAAGVANRVVVCYRDTSIDPVTGPMATVRFREVGRPEQPLIGQMWPTDGTGLVGGDQPWVVQDAAHWFYRGTGLGNGSQIPALVGGEADRRLPEYPSPTLLEGTTSAVLARSPFTTSSGGAAIQESTLYQAPSRAYVFSAGTLRYTRGLMGEGGYGQQSVRSMTTNLFAHFLGPFQSATVGRIGGGDRYATAVALSRKAFATPGVPVAFVATGAAFPDALAAGAATRGKGPVLLVPGATVPRGVLDELARLKPGKVYVVGGSAVVSNAVQTAVSSAAGVQAQRLAGADRYATAAVVSRSVFGGGVPAAFVATGADFPDALAASAAGAQLAGPVLLTGRLQVPTVTRTELSRLAPQRVVTVGGTGVVSETAFQQLTAIVSQVTRLGGSDRYETATLVARDLGAPASQRRVGLATGLTFPDALAAAPVVAAAGGSLLLVSGSLMPALAEELLRSDPDEVMVAGLSGAVPDVVVAAVSSLFAGSVSEQSESPQPHATTSLAPQSGSTTSPDTEFVPRSQDDLLPWLKEPTAQWQHQSAKP